MFNINKTYFISFLVSFIICCVICSPFVPFAINDCYFRLYPLSIGVGIICIFAFFSVLLSRNMAFSFSISDGLITACIVYYLLRYDYSLRLADWKVIYSALLLLFWFAIRIILSIYNLNKVIPVLLSLTGSVLAIWGMMQLYGLADSGNLIFKITGPFFNPGPYSGYLAMLLPICLHGLLNTKGRIRNLFLISILLMVCIIPATMSRSAWIAIIASSIFVLAMHKGWIKLITEYISKNKSKAIGLSVILCFLVIMVGISLFRLKSDSAHGRLLIWKNTFCAITERPFFGYGVGKFPSVYGKTQAEYFTSGKATTIEEHVAGYVEYAFNDYLQLTLEGGIVLLVLVLAWGIIVFRSGMKKREYGTCGALLAFAIFALSSYPLQILPFGILVLLLGTLSEFYDNCKYSLYTYWRIVVVSLLLCMGGLVAWGELGRLSGIYRCWQWADMMLHQAVYDVAVKEYRNLYPYLGGNMVFLHKYATALQLTGSTIEACRVLEREKMLSCNPSVWNTQGLYYQSKGYYREAEVCFLYSLKLVPKRIYPYYLLIRLYLEKGFLNKEKALKMANIVLTKSPKVDSKDIEQMRKEISSLYNQINNL